MKITIKKSKRNGYYFTKNFAWTPVTISHPNNTKVKEIVWLQYYYELIGYVRIKHTETPDPNSQILYTDKYFSAGDFDNDYKDIFERNPNDYYTYLPNEPLNQVVKYNNDNYNKVNPAFTMYYIENYDKYRDNSIWNNLVKIFIKSFKK